MSEPLTEDLVLDMLRTWRPNDVAERMKLGNYHRRTSVDGMMLPEPNACAPHEVPAELRMHRAGHAAESICKTLKVRANKLVNVFNAALEAERQAFARGVPIHDSQIRIRLED